MSFARATIARVAEHARSHISADHQDALETNTYHGFAWSLLQSHGYLLRPHKAIRLLPPPEAASRIVHIPKADRPKEIQRLYEEEGILGFDLFAPLAAELLSRSKRLAAIISDTYPIIIVDEFQDTNSDEWAMIQALGTGSRLIALADAEQRIYEFRGADPARIGEFITAYQPTSFDFGTQNNRSAGTDKLRYGLLVECAGRRIGGDGKASAMDGVYVGGHVRPANYKKNRRDRRLARNRSDKREVVTIAREIGDGGRTILNVAPTEAGSVKYLAQHILPGTTIHVDEAASWNDLSNDYEVLRINHQEAYSHAGACTNAAESLFSRFRKLERGQHHHIAGPYLQRYAVEVAFREDHRRLSQLELTMLILHLALTCGPDPAFKSYGTKVPTR